jgi:hypothetical protein
LELVSGFYGDDSQRFWPNSKVARLNPQREKGHSGLEKATMGMNFSAMELSVLIHALKQQLRPIRRVNQSGMRTNDHSLHLNSEELDEEQQVETQTILLLNP